jgi:hypothetical protein
MVDFGKKNALLIDMNNRVFGTLAFLRKTDTGESDYLDVYYYPLGSGIGQMLMNRPLKYPHSIHKDYVHNDHATEKGIAGVETDIVILFNPREDSMIRRIEVNYHNELDKLRKENDRMQTLITELREEVKSYEASEGLKKGYDDENKDKRRYDMGGFPEVPFGTHY